MNIEFNLFKSTVIALLLAILVALGLCLNREQVFFVQLWDRYFNECALQADALSQDYRLAAARNARAGHFKCAIFQWRVVVEREPTNAQALANLAILLTQAERYQEALPYYEQAVTLGAGAYDMFAWYARNHRALGNTQEAIAWYYRVLSIKPTLVDVTTELSSLLVASDAPYEALALLTGFNTRTGKQHYLKGNIIAIETALSPVSSSQARLRTASIGGHFYLPIKLSEEGDTRGFIVDTGASVMTFDRALLLEDKVPYRRIKDHVRSRLADGRVVELEQVEIAVLRIGPYRLANILATVCDGCVSLLGQNVLEYFNTQKTTIAGIELMSFEKRR